MTGKQEKHSYTGASSCERWVNCPASVQLHKQVGESPTSFYAAEGTHAHWMADYALRHFISVKKNGSMQGWLGSGTNREGHEVVTTQEMIDGVNLYIDTICEDMYYDGLTNNTDGIECPNLQHLNVEQQLNLGFGDCFGTVDAYYVCGDHLTVYDFKYGKGIDVDAKDNYQMQFYALGVVIKLAKATGIPLINDITMKIVQPRSPLCKRIKEHTVILADIRDFREKLKGAIKLVNSKKPPYKANEKWCRWCPGKLICPELRDAIHETAKTDFCHLMPAQQQTELLDIKRMSNLELSALLKNEKLIKDFLKSGKEEAYERLAKGEIIEGFDLVSKLGDRVWIAEAESTLYEQYKDAIYGPKKMLSPAQIEKQLGIKIDELTTRPSSLSITKTEAKHNKTVEQFKDLI